MASVLPNDGRAISGGGGDRFEWSQKAMSVIQITKIRFSPTGPVSARVATPGHPRANLGACQPIDIA